MTERQLLDRFVDANDPDAFRALIERHGPMVFAVCRAVLRETHDAEDAFQNTFLALARGAAMIKNSETIAPWLHRVALRVAKKAQSRASRRRARERTCIDPGSGSQPHRLDPAWIPLLREEVGRLPESYRMPVMLCYLEGKTTREAATQLNCPVGTIKGRLSRARQTLRDRLSRRGLGADSASLGTTSGG